MPGETNLKKILSGLKPRLNKGQYVFCVVQKFSEINPSEILMTFKEEEGYTIVMKKRKADQLGLAYSAVFSWITLTIHSSLNAVGLTAAFSKALSEKSISCNVVAAFFHDHVFVSKSDANRAMLALRNLSKRSKP